MSKCPTSLVTVKDRDYYQVNPKERSNYPKPTKMDARRIMRKVITKKTSVQSNLLKRCGDNVSLVWT